MASDGMKCPRCGRDGLVRCQHEHDDIFQCVYCDYRHDLTVAYSDQKVTTEQVILAMIIVGLVMLPILSLL